MFNWILFFSRLSLSLSLSLVVQRAAEVSRMSRSSAILLALSPNNISYRLHEPRIRRSVNEPPQPPFRKWSHILSMTRRGGGGCGRIILTAPIDQPAIAIPRLLHQRCIQQTVEAHCYPLAEINCREASSSSRASTSSPHHKSTIFRSDDDQTQPVYDFRWRIQ